MKRRSVVLIGSLLVLIFPVAPSRSETESAAIKEIAKKVSSGLEVTLIAAPPLIQAEMMRRGMKGMEGMGMMGMMEMPSEPATHYLGVIIGDQKTQKVIPNLKITLTAKGPVTRKVELMSMPGSYAQNISLAPGKYDIVVRIDFPQDKRKPVEVRFHMQVWAFSATYGYSPLRALNLLTWNNEQSARELTAEAGVKAPASRGEVTIKQPGAVVNMPTLTWPGGRR